MKKVTILALCIFIISISVIAFAYDPAQVKQPEQAIETEAIEDGTLIKEARVMPSTMITGDEEQSRIMKEIEELQERYVYDEDPNE
jgi:hypothetical protein